MLYDLPGFCDICGIFFLQGIRWEWATRACSGLHPDFPPPPFSPLPQPDCAHLPSSLFLPTSPLSSLLLSLPPSVCVLPASPLNFLLSSFLPYSPLPFSSPHLCPSPALPSLLSFYYHCCGVHWSSHTSVMMLLLILIALS